MKDKRKLLSNFFSLAILQGTNYILPLITLPYLVRVLGPGQYGLIAFAQAFIQYFVLITDYGFNLTATREISIHKENKHKVSKIFSIVMFIKLNFMIISFIAMLIIVLLVDKFTADLWIYIFTFGTVVGNVLIPIWFFQGMEKMKFITALNILAKLLSTISIFVFINSADDILMVPLINASSFIFSGILALLIIFMKFKIKISIPNKREIKQQLFEGWHVFISQIAVSLYTISNTFILGVFTNNTIVGYYASGEKLVKAVQGLIQPISQTIYPHISKLASNSKREAIRFISKAFYFVGFITLIMSSILLFFAEPIVSLVLGNQYTNSIIVVQILSFLPFIIGLSNILGIQTMLTFNYKKEFSKIIITSSILNLVIAFIMVNVMSYIGISLSVLFTEVLVTVCMFIFLYKKGIRMEVRNV